ncbi:hypothetical protein IGS67_06770 [Flavimobilis sp. GY10621]|uniref:Uncharacterized protein n=1 Tax=Flavimobilis rhizosphaerae TaxID=2775421 RepID=A0ABR9DQK2_9MICO|nr:hypothetical protein [Flavimobilis rhizosphaerae]MBD9699194.1 hypothetical protein [Flavimobilis rhizosphaerae]
MKMPTSSTSTVPTSCQAAPFHTYVVTLAPTTGVPVSSTTRPVRWAPGVSVVAPRTVGSAAVRTSAAASMMSEPS